MQLIVGVFSVFAVQCLDQFTNAHVVFFTSSFLELHVPVATGPALLPHQESSPP